MCIRIHEYMYNVNYVWDILIIMITTVLVMIAMMITTMFTFGSNDNKHICIITYLYICNVLCMARTCIELSQCVNMHFSLELVLIANHI